MKIYLVGGAVRDQLLGLPVKEKDWVVVGATPEELLRQGFKQVGKEFPVFLHPQTGEEYALARTERKVAPGYSGFVFDTSAEVTLEEDLVRRDLTINAMAQTATGELIDPYQGKEDLQKRILRHVSQAFVEDPVRILRTARFAARYAEYGFTVAPETIALMKTMVASGEVNALVAERVWKELERALGEKSPSVFFEVLASCQALAILFPMVARDSAALHILKSIAPLTTDTQVRFAIFMQPFPKDEVLWMCQRYRLPTDYRDLAILLKQVSSTLLQFPAVMPDELLQAFSRADAFRREQRFNKILHSCAILAKLNNRSFAADKLKQLYQQLKQIDVQALINQGFQGAEIANKLKKERLALIERWLIQC